LWNESSDEEGRESDSEGRTPPRRICKLEDTLKIRKKKSERTLYAHGPPFVSFCLLSHLPSLLCWWRIAMLGVAGWWYGGGGGWG
jgi:hypothetical protein